MAWSKHGPLALVSIVRNWHFVILYLPYEPRPGLQHMEHCLEVSLGLSQGNTDNLLYFGLPFVSTVCRLLSKAAHCTPLPEGRWGWWYSTWRRMLSHWYNFEINMDIYIKFSKTCDKIRYQHSIKQSWWPYDRLMIRLMIIALNIHSQLKAVVNKIY